MFDPDKEQDTTDREVERYAKSGDDQSYVKNHFFDKVKRYAGKIPFVFDAVCLYYCALDPETPTYAKAIAFAALAYLILPLDAVADWLPLVGFADDAGAVAAAIGSLAAHINNEHRNQASQFLYNRPYRKEI